MSPIFKRVDHLRVVTGKTWAELSAELEVDRSMLFHVKSGRRNLSPKAIYRLEQAETAAGIKSALDAKTGAVGGEHGLQSAIQSSHHVLETLVPEAARERALVADGDFLKGYSEVKVQYKSRAPLKGYPGKIRLTSPRAQVVAKFKFPSDDNLEDLVMACLPLEHANSNFLKTLAPSSFIDLLETTLILSYGYDWRKQYRLWLRKREKGIANSHQ